MDDRFELSILDSGDPGRIIVIAKRNCDLAVEALPCTQLKSLMKFRSELAEAADGKRGRPTLQSLFDFGKDLFQLTVRGSVARVYGHLQANEYVRLHIFSNHTDIQSLPWEYIQEADSGPGPNCLRTVVRIVPTIGITLPEPRSLDKVVRMLFVYSDPIDLGPVNWDQIKKTIEGDFAAQLPGKLKIDVVEAATSKSLLSAIKEKDYDVLHFAGHGEVADGVGQLLLMDIKTKKSQPIVASALGTILKGSSLRLVVLSACSSSAGDFAKEYAVVAKTLVEYGVPAVVANQFPITNTMAASFAGEFYRELLRSGDVDRAVSNGRLMLSQEPALPNGAARIEWGIPTLFRHVCASQVFK